MRETTLYWLPECEDFRARARSLLITELPPTWADLVALANHNLDFIQTNSLDRILAKHYGAGAAPDSVNSPRGGDTRLFHRYPAARGSSRGRPPPRTTSPRPAGWS
jgi:hypothetical protein